MNFIVGLESLNQLIQGNILYDKDMNLEYRINLETSKMEKREALYLDIDKSWYECTLTINELLSTKWAIKTLLL